MEILNWKIFNEDGYWRIKIFTKDFGWLDIKERFYTAAAAGEYLQKRYNK